MGEMIYWELGYVLSCILWGLFLMLVYDILRISRLVWQKGSIRISIEDILYWSCAAIGTFRLFYRQDNGVIRWFAIAATFFVMLFMNRFISRWTVPFISRILRVPVTWMEKLLQKIAGFFQKIAQKCWRRLKFIRKKVTIKENAYKKAAKENQKEKQKEKKPVKKRRKRKHIESEAE